MCVYLKIACLSGFAKVGSLFNLHTSSKDTSGICENIKPFLMCVNWCLVILSGGGSVGWWLSTLENSAVLFKLTPYLNGISLCFFPGL